MLYLSTYGNYLVQKGAENAILRRYPRGDEIKVYCPKVRSPPNAKYISFNAIHIRSCWSISITYRPYFLMQRFHKVLYFLLTVFGRYQLFTMTIELPFYFRNQQFDLETRTAGYAIINTEISVLYAAQNLAHYYKFLP